MVSQPLWHVFGGALGPQGIVRTMSEEPAMVLFPDLVTAQRPWACWEPAKCIGNSVIPIKGLRLSVLQVIHLCVFCDGQKCINFSSSHC